LVTIAALDPRHRGLPGLLFSMIETVFVKRLRAAQLRMNPLRAELSRAIGPAVIALAASLTFASAQQSFPAPPPPAATARNPACIRLEGQLATIDRGSYDPARAEQVKRLEENVSRQQAELDRQSAQARRMGCEGRGFFSLFGGAPAQCAPVNNQIAQTRANLDRVLADLQGVQGNTADREGERRNVLVALGQNDCGPQYRQFASRNGGGPAGFFDRLFGGAAPGGGPGSILTPNVPETAQGNTYRTLCVRTCDGFYFPVSYSTVPAKFADDEKVCQAMCPASEVALYSHRNPGEDISQAVSISGKNYTEMPNAFAYRKAFNPSCACKASGETWAQALKHLDDPTVERGDIIVNEERARQLSQPQVDAQGKPIRPARSNAAGAKSATPAAAAKSTAPAATPTVETTEDSDPAKRQVRTVGPTFYPVR
jgi:hypothetical protein